MSPTETGVPVISCVVEGHGEVQAVPLLVQRVAAEWANGWAEVPPPFRVHRDRVVRADELERAVRFAALRVPEGAEGGVLVVMDADDDCPAELGPTLLARARAAAGSRRAEVVLAKAEFESWFVAAAESLAGARRFPSALTAPERPEEIRNAKGWLTGVLPPGRSYSPTVDQAGLAATFDLGVARQRSQSFDKFCRAVLSLVRPAS